MVKLWSLTKGYFLDRIEYLRGLSKSLHLGDLDARRRLIEEVRELNDEDMVAVARAFTQFLNLANIAEQHHRVRRMRGDLKDSDPYLDESALPNLLSTLSKTNTPDAIVEKTMQVSNTLRQ